MARIETYRARRGAKVEHETAAPAASGYTIEVHFLGGLTDRQKAAFRHAANRWTHVIIGDLPDVIVGTETINNLRITAQGTDIDGPRGILGQAGRGGPRAPHPRPRGLPRPRAGARVWSAGPGTDAGRA